MAKETRVYVGTSGWYYDHWQGVLYPEGLPKGKRLQLYQEHFNAVEVNNTYYRYPTKHMIQNWHDKAPKGFIYAVKMNRGITHYHRLSEVDELLGNFMAAVQPLADKLGILLIQLPPDLDKDVPRLRSFAEGLDTHFRYAIEFRNETWEDDEVFEVLQQHNLVHVVVEARNYPWVEVHTTDQAYFRLHGPEARFASGYPDDFLEELAGKIDRLSEEGKTSYTFFNNDYKGHAVKNAWTLNGYLGRVPEGAKMV